MNQFSSTTDWNNGPRATKALNQFSSTTGWNNGSVVTTNQLKDWIKRLTDCASEAWHEGLGPLESDILDIRDEMDKLV